MDIPQLNEEQKAILIESLEEKIKGFEDQIKAHRVLISTIKNGKAPDEIVPKRTFKWRDICQDIIRAKDTLLKTDEIYNEVISIHSNLEGEGRKKTIISSLSGTLSVLKQDKILDRIENPSGTGSYYGLSEWFEKPSLPSQKYRDKFIARTGIKLKLNNEGDLN